MRTRIRTRSPKYAELMQPIPINAGEIQKLLGDDTILLEYLMGEERGYLVGRHSDFNQGIRSAGSSRA